MKTMYGRVEIYRDKARMWRWRIRARNGKITATPNEGYVRRVDAIRSVSAILDNPVMPFVTL